jgi:hypothetical protein
MEPLFDHETEDQETEAAEAAPAVDESVEAESEEQKGEIETATPAEETVDEAIETTAQTVPLAALQEQRKKRQEVESERQELRQQVAFLQGQQQAMQNRQPVQEQEDPEAAKDRAMDEYWSDPTGYVDKRIQAGVTAVTAGRVQDKINLSEAMVKRQHDDYDDVVGVFVDAAKANPALAEQMRSEPNPALFAYDYGKKIQDVAQYSTIEEMRSKLRAEIEAEIAAKSKSSQSLEAAAGISRTNAGARSTAPAASSPMSDDIFADFGKGILS